MSCEGNYSDRPLPGGIQVQKSGLGPLFSVSRTPAFAAILRIQGWDRKEDLVSNPISSPKYPKTCPDGSSRGKHSGGYRSIDQIKGQEPVFFRGNLTLVRLSASSTPVRPGALSSACQWEEQFRVETGWLTGLAQKWVHREGHRIAGFYLIFAGPSRNAPYVRGLVF